MVTLIYRKNAFYCEKKPETCPLCKISRARGGRAFEKEKQQDGDFRTALSEINKWLTEITFFMERLYKAKASVRIKEPVDIIKTAIPLTSDKCVEVLGKLKEGSREITD